MHASLSGFTLVNNTDTDIRELGIESTAWTAIKNESELPEEISDMFTIIQTVFHTWTLNWA